MPSPRPGARVETHNGRFQRSPLIIDERDIPNQSALKEQKYQALSCSIDALRAGAAHPKVPAAVKQRLREQYRALDPVTLLAEIRVAQ
jgi:hypothetical protein